MPEPLSLGLPQMHKEAGERRAFLPAFVRKAAQHGYRLVLEHGYGGGMGLSESDYRHAAPGAQFAPCEEAYQQDIVLVLRYPEDDELRLMRPGATLISMVHYPTRPQRVERLRDLGLEAISLDSVVDDRGRRLVENLHAVGWNGMREAMRVLRGQFPAPGFDSPDRPPIRVTLLGAGAVGGHVMRAAPYYGDPVLRSEMVAAGAPGVMLTVVDYDLTPYGEIMLDLLARTDVLVDATQRPDPSATVVPNEWIAVMPGHAVLLDLSVDPYHCDGDEPSVKGIEGIPQGNLDQYVFMPDDPAWDTLPECVHAAHRRAAVSCYSWPGVNPRACMQVYGSQISPLLRAIQRAGGVAHIDPEGRFFARAISRAMLSRLP